MNERGLLDLFQHMRELAEFPLGTQSEGHDAMTGLDHVGLIGLLRLARFGAAKALNLQPALVEQRGQELPPYSAGAYRRWATGS